LHAEHEVSFCVCSSANGDLAYESREDELKLNRTEMSMIRWMCGVKLNARKKSEELRKLLGLEPVSLMIKNSRLRWSGHVERKDDNDWVKRCITWEVQGIRLRGHPKKTWWDCVKNDMESLGLSHKDAQSRNKWRRRIKGATG